MKRTIFIGKIGDFWPTMKDKLYFFVFLTSIAVTSFDVRIYCEETIWKSHLQVGYSE